MQSIDLPRLRSNRTSCLSRVCNPRYPHIFHPIYGCTVIIVIFGWDNRGTIKSNAQQHILTKRLLDGMTAGASLNGDMKYSI
eukprot:154260-Amorphochlora_amoeboformis.AAC.2